MTVRRLLRQTALDYQFTEMKLFVYCKLHILNSDILTSLIIRAWTVRKRNLRFFSKFNQNAVRLFQASFRRVLGGARDLVVLDEFLKVGKTPKNHQKMIKHHQAP